MSLLVSQPLGRLVTPVIKIDEETVISIYCHLVSCLLHSQHMFRRFPKKFAPCRSLLVDLRHGRGGGDGGDGQGLWEAGAGRVHQAAG